MFATGSREPCAIRIDRRALHVEALSTPHEGHGELACERRALAVHFLRSAPCHSRAAEDSVQSLQTSQAAGRKERTAGVADEVDVRSVHGDAHAVLAAGAAVAVVHVAVVVGAGLAADRSADGVHQLFVPCRPEAAAVGEDGGVRAVHTVDIVVEPAVGRDAEVGDACRTALAGVASPMLGLTGSVCDFYLARCR